MSLQVVVNFKVLDESDDWIVVDKPAPLIVHPANRKPEPTLLGGVEHLLAYEIENGARPAIVNRLDRDTSGMVLIAKHTAAARELGMFFERREAEKEYLAIVTGWPEADAWDCADPILRAGEIGPSAIWVRQIVHPFRAGLSHAVSRGAALRARGAEVFPDPVFSRNRAHAPDPRAFGSRRTPDCRRQALLGRRVRNTWSGWREVGRRTWEIPAPAPARASCARLSECRSLTGGNRVEGGAGGGFAGVHGGHASAGYRRGLSSGAGMTSLRAWPICRKSWRSWSGN